MRREDVGYGLDYGPMPLDQVAGWRAGAIQERISRINQADSRLQREGRR